MGAEIRAFVISGQKFGMRGRETVGALSQCGVIGNANRRRSMITNTTAAGAALASVLTASPMIANAEAPAFVVQIVQFESNKTREEVLAAAAERKPQFEAMEGLIQKYYLEMDAPNSYGGVYIWKDKAAMAAFLESDLFKGIPAAYGIASAPHVQIAPGLYPLR